MTELLEFVPTLRADFLRREIDGETVVWSPLVGEPTVLDPVATVMLDVIDGQATVGQMATEVHEEVGVGPDIARHEVTRIVELFGGIGLLTASTSTTPASDAIAARELFVNPCISCMEGAVKSMSTMTLGFGDRRVGVACYPPRAARKLRSALGHHIVESSGDDPVGFVLTGPTNFQRSHKLADRSGFVHSEGRGLEAGMHALASHLTAFTPEAPGTVRVRASAVAAGGRIVVCLFPLLLLPRLDETTLSAAGYGAIDRLALDIDVATGSIVNPPIPWPDLSSLRPGPGHLGSCGTGDVVAVVSASQVGSPPPGRAAAAAELASGALSGTPGQVLEAVSRVVEEAEHRWTAPEEGRLVEVLAELR